MGANRLNVCLAFLPMAHGSWRRMRLLTRGPQPGLLGAPTGFQQDSKHYALTGPGLRLISSYLNIPSKSEIGG